MSEFKNRSEWRAAVFARDLHSCQRCGQRADECHHRLYRSRGGRDDLLNGVALCMRCHAEVHATSEAPWVVAGYITRGLYVGSDPEFLKAYGDGRRAA